MIYDNNIITGDLNAHHHTWYSPYTDHRGTTINNIINDSDYTIINENQPTRLPIPTHRQRQQPTSPDLTIIPTHLSSNTTWTTVKKLSSDHLPILTTTFIVHKHKKSFKKKTFTNFNKALWTDYTHWIDQQLRNHTPSDNIQQETDIITSTIINADKKFIPRGNINKKTKPIPQHILSKIHDRNQLRSTAPNHPQIPILNQEINKSLSEHKQQIWKNHIESTWDHKNNQTTYWKTIKSLNNKLPITNDPNRSINFNNSTANTNKEIANSFNKYFTNPTNYQSDRTKRTTLRALHNLETTPLIFSTPQTLKAISKSKPSKALGPDHLAPIHLKHLSYYTIDRITKLYNNIINHNIIPNSWKTAKVIPVLKPNKDPNQHTSYRPIALLSPLAKILESIIHTIIKPHLPQCPHQHGFKPKHSTTTALHSIIDPIIRGFNQKQPPQRTALIAIDFSQAFDTVNIYTLINKIIHNTTIPNILKKFIGNYIHGRQGYTSYNNHNSKIHIFKTGVPQGGVISPVLFNLYLSDIPTPTNPRIHLTSYADDITITASHSNYRTAETILQPYLNRITNWAIDNNLKLNTGKTQTTLFTPDPAEYSKSLNLSINNDLLATNPFPIILGLNFDPKLTFSTHIKYTKTKAYKTIKIYKALTGSSWGKHKDTLLHTYKTITRPILEYACSTWAPIISSTNNNHLQIVQNQIARIATGHTADTNNNIVNLEAKLLPIASHTKIHSSNFRYDTTLPDHPLNHLHYNPTPPRLKRKSIFNHTDDLITLHTAHHDQDQLPHKTQAKKIIHTQAVQQHLATIPDNSILHRRPPDIDETEKQLTRKTQRTLAQLRANKSPFLLSYLNHIDPTSHPSPLCPLCEVAEHNTTHLFECPHVPTVLDPDSLWSNLAPSMDGGPHGGTVNLCLLG